MMNKHLLAVSAILLFPFPANAASDGDIACVTVSHVPGEPTTFKLNNTCKYSLDVVIKEFLPLPNNAKHCRYAHRALPDKETFKQIATVLTAANADRVYKVPFQAQPPIVVFACNQGSPDCPPKDLDNRYPLSCDTK